MKRQKDMILKDELPRLVGAQYALEKSGEVTPERIEAEPKWKQCSGLDVSSGGSKV